MVTGNRDFTGPDLAQGVELSRLSDGMLEGHVDKKPVLVLQRSDGFVAIEARCSHYHAPLKDGLVVGDTIRCPWHHACFDIMTGEALGALCESACGLVGGGRGAARWLAHAPNLGQRPVAMIVIIRHMSEEARSVDPVDRAHPAAPGLPRRDQQHLRALLRRGPWPLLGDLGE